MSGEEKGTARKKEKKKISHLTMMVIPHSHGASVKNYCIPMWLFKSFMILSVSCILVVGYFVAGFFYLRYVTVENKELKEINMAQAKEINELKGLAGSMRSKLEYLVQLDQEVRAKVGLIKPANNEQNDRSILSSRSETRYQLMTMGISAIASAGSQPLLVQADIVAPQESTGLVESGEVLELPVPENEIDTLEDLGEQLALMDQMLTQQAEAMNRLNSDVDKRLAYLNALPNAWPIQGRITSGFGWRRNPFSRGQEFHEGIDIAQSYGAPIRASGDGVVTFAGYKSGWGRVVVISHGFGYVSQYCHNSSLLVSTGERVKRGQIIARLGNTGRSTGPHLHFGVAKEGKWINPMTVIGKKE
ncbi:MAG: M23 family metallopeptidase [Peptococcaceae bacterium]|jgi:murein DD-endopeptidase MepM/ murein hydrolase activator NlpD|nr:M23 family metallopeptidase [Peptococcaceae bacterium]MDH7523808.1 M23 family metallopeptidase [Peptococcaceae bacterium]